MSAGTPTISWSVSTRWPGRMPTPSAKSVSPAPSEPREWTTPRGVLVRPAGEDDQGLVVQVDRNRPTVRFHAGAGQCVTRARRERCTGQPAARPKMAGLRYEPGIRRELQSAPPGESAQWRAGGQ